MLAAEITVDAPDFGHLERSRRHCATSPGTP
jgi:hypothetical protein